VNQCYKFTYTPAISPTAFLQVTNKKQIQT
jgi:hypothetical protein